MVDFPATLTKLINWASPSEDHKKLKAAYEAAQTKFETGVASQASNISRYLTTDKRSGVNMPTPFYGVPVSVKIIKTNADMCKLANMSIIKTIVFTSRMDPCVLQISGTVQFQHDPRDDSYKAVFFSKGIPRSTWFESGQKFNQADTSGRVFNLDPIKSEDLTESFDTALKELGVPQS